MGNDDLTKDERVLCGMGDRIALVWLKRGDHSLAWARLWDDRGALALALRKRGVGWL
jgi:hypothetical protein